MAARHDKWWRDFRAVMRRLPKGAELIVTGDDGAAELWPAGTMERHLGSRHGGFGLDGNPELGEPYATGVFPGLRPYGEGQ